MRAAEHRNVGIVVRHRAQFVDQLIQGRQDDFIATGFELQRVAGVVDVFAGAGKVHKFTGGLEFGMSFEFVFEPILHGFHIVVGGFFDVFDGQGVFGREAVHQAQQILTRRSAERLELLKARIAQGDEPSNFNLHAAVHIALLAHQRTQGGKFGGVAAIERRQGRYWSCSHLAILS